MNANISKLIKELEAVEITKSHIKELNKLLKASELRIREIDEEIKSKVSKIETLEQSSFQRLYLTLTRNYKNVLDITKEHYILLCLEYNELQKERELLKYEIKVLTKKTVKITAIKAKLREVIKEEAELLIDQSKIKVYKKLVTKLERKYRIEKEMEEAIDEGVFLNKKFNDAIKYLMKIPKHVYDIQKDIKDLKEYDGESIGKFQEKVLRIKHSMVKFKSEVNEVFVQLNLVKDDYNYYSASFIMEYRKKLARDIILNKGLNKSLIHLDEQKKLVLEFTKTLRKDLRKVRKEISLLEEDEMETLNLID